MFDFDAGKLLIVGVIALVVIGPKELPRVLRQVGQAVARLRRMASEFQGQFMDAMKEADLQSIRDEVDKVTRESTLHAGFDPIRDVHTELTRSIEARTPPAEPVALAATIEAPTSDFAIPAAETLIPAGETETLAAAGLAPVVEGDLPPLSLVDASPVAAAPSPHGPDVATDGAATADGRDAAAGPALRKRKIIQARRAPRRGPHDVSDRTRFGGQARLRLKAMEP